MGASANDSTWGVMGVTLERAAPGDIYRSYATELTEGEPANRGLTGR